MAHSQNQAPYSIADYEKGFQDEGKILGLECNSCKFKMMTQVLRCPKCGGTVKGIELVKTGKVKSFTVQNVPSDEFLNDAPYAYALIELDDGATISAWMPEVKAEGDIHIGDRVHWKQSYKVGLIFERDQVA